MLPLKNVESMLGECEDHLPFCSVSGCADEVHEVYVTIEGRSIPMCETHYEMIASHTLW